MYTMYTIHVYNVYMYNITSGTNSARFVVVQEVVVTVEEDSDAVPPHVHCSV